MLKMKFWFEGNQLQPDCNIHGGCKIGSSACHACPHCVRVNSKDQEVLCLGDGSGYKEVKLEELRVGDRFKTVKNVYGTLYTVREIKSGKISEVFLDEDEGELAVNQDGTTIYLYEMNTEVDSLIVNEETMNIEKEEGDGEEECAVIDTTIGVEPENLYRYYGTREECLVYIQEHLNEPNLGIVP